MESLKQLSFDITENFQGGDENSVAARASLSDDSIATAKSMILAEIERLERVGLTCDEIEQQLLFSHQTASSRITQLKADGKIIQRYDSTPTEGRYKATRATRTGCSAAVYIAKRFADGYEIARADEQRTRRKGKQ